MHKHKLISDIYFSSIYIHITVFRLVKNFSFCDNRCIKNIKKPIPQINPLLTNNKNLFMLPIITEARCIRKKV